LGDTYAGSGKGAEGYSDKSTLTGYTSENTKGRNRAKESWHFEKAPKGNGQSKSLIQIPSRFAIEMTNRGWILRNEIIWHKPNSMPSSVKDRFTVDFEKMFFFTKSKKYYFETQREPHKKVSLNRIKNPWHGNLTKGHALGGLKDGDMSKMCHPDGRNKRAVWTINTKSYKGAHFAVYPPELIEIPIKAGCPKGGIVLDPFTGSGTTGVVALEFGRKFIGIELNKEYCSKIATKRLETASRRSKLKLFF